MKHKKQIWILIMVTALLCTFCVAECTSKSYVNGDARSIAQLCITAEGDGKYKVTCSNNGNGVEKETQLTVINGAFIDPPCNEFGCEGKIYGAITTFNIAAGDQASFTCWVFNRVDSREWSWSRQTKIQMGAGSVNQPTASVAPATSGELVQSGNVMTRIYGWIMSFFKKLFGVIR